MSRWPSTTLLVTLALLLDGALSFTPPLWNGVRSKHEALRANMAPRMGDDAEAAARKAWLARQGGRAWLEGKEDEQRAAEEQRRQRAEAEAQAAREMEEIMAAELARRAAAEAAPGGGQPQSAGATPPVTLGATLSSPSAASAEADKAFVDLEATLLGDLEELFEKQEAEMEAALRTAFFS